MPSRTLRGSLAALAATVAVAGVALVTERAGDDAHTPGALATTHARVQLSDPPRGDAAALLATLPVRTDPEIDDYRRDAFGDGWSDPDGNGCDTREDLLAAAAVPGTILLGDDGCLDDASLPDPYTGATLTPRTADIDHVVSLGDAWQSGAATWTPDRRARFAEDTANLLPVYDRANAAKGDRTADAWLPSAPGSACPYVARQVAVKASNGLSVTATERGAMHATLADCPGEPVPAPR